MNSFYSTYFNHSTEELYLKFMNLMAALMLFYDLYVFVVAHVD